MTDDVLARFSAPVRTWFTTTFRSPTPAQAQGWPAIAAGEHTLILAPTGSGKTLSAFLWAIDRLTSQPVPPREQRLRVVYVSPLRALAVDGPRRSTSTATCGHRSRASGSPPSGSAARSTGPRSACGQVTHPRPSVPGCGGHPRTS
jgi:ATP-dependent helicase Lhr and Lhr-like helicase